MPVVRNITGVHNGVNSFDLDQSQGTLNNENTDSTFVSFLESSTRYIQQIADTFSLLRAGDREGVLAFVENSSGTSWLPYTVGGTYYPKGWYVWDGALWVSSRSNVAATLESLDGSGGGSSFSGDYNDLTNTPTIPTQITDVEIAALGYVKTDNDTQLSDGDIAAFGYVKTDNNTQLSDADITALGYVKSSGSTIEFFQAQDSGLVAQTTTAA
mgnify:FL=1